MNDILSIEPLRIEACLIAISCAFAIGLERQLSGKSAGVRTSILICVGAYTFVALAAFYEPEIGAPRVLGQVVTGVGFLGAGVMISDHGLVHGVTTAAVIWILAAIGSLIGFGNYAAAVALTTLTILVVFGISFLEKTFKRLKTGVHSDTDGGQPNSKSPKL